jgi:signal transduction histidine kinase/FixJ family two-component response regulator
MVSPINILHLEDDPLDAALVLDKLHGDGLDVSVHRVSTFEDFRKELEDKKYHAIISDYAVPGVNTNEVIRYARTQRPDLPFIVVSGTVGEEFAIEALKLGATDYVLKQRPARLPVALRRALREAEELVSKRETENRYFTLLQSIDEGFCILKLLYVDHKVNDWLIVEVNPAYERHSGLKNAKGKRIREVAPTMEKYWLEAYGKVVETGGSFRATQYSEAFGRWFEAYATRVGQPEDHQVAVVFRDVSERVRAQEALRQSEERYRQLSASLEKQVEARTAELKDINQQLEAFSYTIAHDLRAPLRAQEGFATAVLEEYGDVLGEKGRGYVEKIASAANRLSLLVTDLLRFSMLSRMDMTLRPIPLKAMIEQAFRESEMVVREAKAHVHAENNGYFVCANDTMLQMALVNLISNGVKFSKPGVEPEVKVWAEARGPYVRIWVEDNGIGIAPEHHQQIFGVFNRLHQYGTYPGTGVGLAIVQKAAERMGGRTGVESEEGKGSRFWIELQRP